MKHDFTATIGVAIDRLGSDPAEQDELVTRLLADLRARGLDGIQQISRVLPESTNGGRSKVAGEIVGWGQILVSLAASGGVLVTFIKATRDWLTLQPPKTVVKIKLGDKVLDISSAEPEMVERLVRAFLEQK